MPPCAMIIAVYWLLLTVPGRLQLQALRLHAGRVGLRVWLRWDNFHLLCFDGAGEASNEVDLAPSTCLPLNPRPPITSRSLRSWHSSPPSTSQGLWPGSAIWRLQAVAAFQVACHARVVAPEKCRSAGSPMLQLTTQGVQGKDVAPMDAE